MTGYPSLDLPTLVAESVFLLGLLVLATSRIVARRDRRRAAVRAETEARWAARNAEAEAVWLDIVARIQADDEPTIETDGLPLRASLIEIPREGETL